MRKKVVWSVLALFLGVCLADAVPAAAGDISGTVTIKSKIRKRAQGSIRKRPRPGGYGSYDRPPVTLPEDEVLHVVIFIEKIDSYKPPANLAPAVMIQEGKEFIPHVLPVVSGQSVSFPNKDKIYHNVYSESSGNKFELPEYRGGETRDRAFGAPGIVELFCGIHTNMNAYLLVLQNHYFAKPDDAHRYTIKDVPPGEYKIVAWHPRVDKVEQTVKVPKTGSVKLDFNL